MGIDQFSVLMCDFSLLDLKKDRLAFIFDELSIQWNVYLTNQSQLSTLSKWGVKTFQ